MILTFLGYFNFNVKFYCHAQQVSTFSYFIIFGQFIGDYRGVNSTSKFSISTQEIWKIIKNAKAFEFGEIKVIINMF